MARPKSTDIVDLSEPHDLTIGLIERLRCPDGKPQAFLRDTRAPGLRVRVTRAGTKAFVFEAWTKGKTMRWTIGDVRAWTIDQARTEANRLRVEVDRGQDPREVVRQAAAKDRAESITVGDVWQTYLDEGKPKRKAAWKPRYKSDLIAMGSPGGEPKKRGGGKTRPGPIHPLMSVRLCDINEDRLKDWFDEEAKRGAHQATRALMMFRGFLRWAAGRGATRALVNRDAGRAPQIIEALPPKTRRRDALEPSQVGAWWGAVEALENQTASAYLRALLLTGARREEIAGMRWKDIDLRWRKFTIADKVNASRELPLPPYLAQLIGTLPRVNEYVFAADSASGHIIDARSAHATALGEAGLEWLTMHGLRRSFSMLAEDADAPAGAVAQIMGHTPATTQEDYRPRSIDRLRPIYDRIEAYILASAGVEFVADQGPWKPLRMVA